MLDIFNESEHPLEELEGLIQDLFSFSNERFGFKDPPSLFLKSDSENAKNALGRTGSYEPSEMKIMVFVDGRHPKDILRSISHELIHHMQNLRGDFDHEFDTSEGYAQNDPHLRDMEEEAYSAGNLCFRDWEDSRKQQLAESKCYNNIIGGDDMSKDKRVPLKEWKNAELNSQLMKKFGLVSEDAGAEQLYHEETTAENVSGEETLEEDEEPESTSASTTLKESKTLVVEAKYPGGEKTWFKTDKRLLEPDGNVSSHYQLRVPDWMQHCLYDDSEHCKEARAEWDEFNAGEGTHWYSKKASGDAGGTGGRGRGPRRLSKFDQLKKTAKKVWGKIFKENTEPHLPISPEEMKKGLLVKENQQEEQSLLEYFVDYTSGGKETLNESWLTDWWDAKVGGHGPKLVVPPEATVWQRAGAGGYRAPVTDYGYEGEYDIPEKIKRGSKEHSMVQKFMHELPQHRRPEFVGDTPKYVPREGVDYIKNTPKSQGLSSKTAYDVSPLVRAKKLARARDEIEAQKVPTPADDLAWSAKTIGELGSGLLAPYALAKYGPKALQWGAKGLDTLSSSPMAFTRHLPRQKFGGVKLPPKYYWDDYVRYGDTVPLSTLDKIKGAPGKFVDLAKSGWHAGRKGVQNLGWRGKTAIGIPTAATAYEAGDYFSGDPWMGRLPGGVHSKTLKHIDPETGIVFAQIVPKNQARDLMTTTGDIMYPHPWGSDSYDYSDKEGFATIDTDAGRHAKKLISELLPGLKAHIGSKMTRQGSDKDETKDYLAMASQAKLLHKQGKMSTKVYNNLMKRVDKEFVGKDKYGKKVSLKNWVDLNDEDRNLVKAYFRSLLASTHAHEAGGQLTPEMKMLYNYIMPEGEFKTPTFERPGDKDQLWKLIQQNITPLPGEAPVSQRFPQSWAGRKDPILVTDPEHLKRMRGGYFPGIRDFWLGTGQGGYNTKTGKVGPGYFPELPDSSKFDETRDEDLWHELPAFKPFQAIPNVPLPNFDVEEEEESAEKQVAPAPAKPKPKSKRKKRRRKRKPKDPWNRYSWE